MSPTVFSILDLPRAFFRDPYLIVSVWQPSSTTWRAEYHILTKRPHEHLMTTSFDCDPTTLPPDEPPVDEKYMVQEALCQAEFGLIAELDKLAHEHHDPELSTRPFSFKPANVGLASLWTLVTYTDNFANMASVTSSLGLKKHLSMVMSMKRLPPA